MPIFSFFIHLFFLCVCVDARNKDQMSVYPWDDLEELFFFPSEKETRPQALLCLLRIRKGLYSPDPNQQKDALQWYTWIKDYEDCQMILRSMLDEYSSEIVGQLIHILHAGKG